MRAFEGIAEERLPAGVSLYRGKVRDVLDTGSHLMIVTSDRISAFDRPLGTIAGKGEILNQLALSWFHQTKDIISNHILHEVTNRAVLVKKAQVVPIEVVVRGYLTGSAWKEYAAGRTVPGLSVPPGMRAHQRLEAAQITPTTKEAVGAHDQPISREEILRRGLVSPLLWGQIEEAALALFAHGQQLLAQRGLILVDTKYEFGLCDNKLLVVDEMHTPDCSRFWFADDYAAAFAQGKEPRKLDKEYLRSWLAGAGFQGEGPIPAIPEAVFDETRQRYVEAFELITGRRWSFSGMDPEAETVKILSSLSE